MKSKLSIGSKVKVSWEADEWPYERIADDGTIVENSGRKYLVALKRGRENRLFPRLALHPIEPK